MIAISAHELTRTRICAYRNCGEDARPNSDLCDEHDREEAAKFGEAPAPGVTCKRPGCPNPRAAQMGPYGGLCDVHAAQASEERRRARRDQSRGSKRREAVPPPAAVSEPAQDPVPDDSGAIPEDGSLVALAQRVDELYERRRAMLAELDATEAELRDAITAIDTALDDRRVEAA